MKGSKEGNIMMGKDFRHTGKKPRDLQSCIHFLLRFLLVSRLDANSSMKLYFVLY